MMEMLRPTGFSAAEPGFEAIAGYGAWAVAGVRDAAKRATALWQQALGEYGEPPLDPAVREELAACVARRKEEIGGGAP